MLVLSILTMCENRKPFGALTSLSILGDKFQNLKVYSYCHLKKNYKILDVLHVKFVDNSTISKNVHRTKCFNQYSNKNCEI